jgi:hypothetical protein
MAARGDTVETTADSQEALRTISDKPLEGDAYDRRYFCAYADAIAELLDHPATDTSLTMAISTQWGAGKTSLAKMIEGRLKRRPIQRGDPPHIACWFNAWIHDDAPHLGAAFATEVAKTADRNGPMRRRFVGHASNIEFVRAAFESVEPPCSRLHNRGRGGMGKSSLLDSFARFAADIKREPARRPLRQESSCRRGPPTRHLGVPLEGSVGEAIRR